LSTTINALKPPGQAMHPRMGAVNQVARPNLRRWLYQSGQGRLIVSLGSRRIQLQLFLPAERRHPAA